MDTVSQMLNSQLSAANTAIIEGLRYVGLDKLADFHTDNPVLALLYSVLAVGGSGYFVKFVRAYFRRKELDNKRKDKQKSAAEMFVNFEKIISKYNMTEERVTEITTMKVTDLLHKLKNEEITATETLHAFQIKALKSHKDCNCLTEPLFEAEDQAQACDAALKKDKILHGLPISVKENFFLEGYDCTGGLSSYINKPAPDDAVLVKVLKHHGAIPFVRTNIPQTMLSWDTCNPIYGQTVHPKDHKRAVGGSSGGECALLSTDGSPLGFGSDIGGSIRIPANMCGVYGLKPCSKRVSNKGTHPILKVTPVKASYGPLGRCVEDLAVAMKALLSPPMFVLDPTIPPLSFNNQVYESNDSLRIGYYVDNGVISAVPSQQRAVYEVRELLEKLGHTMVPWSMPGSETCESWYLYSNSMAGDGGFEILNAVKDDKTDHSMNNFIRVMSLPTKLKRLLSYILSLLSLKAESVAIGGSIGLGSARKAWEFNIRIEEFRRRVEWDWRDHRLDVVICPGLATPAMPVGAHGYCSGVVSYTCEYNVLDFPAGSVPVTTVTKEDVNNMENYKAKGLWETTIKKGQKGSEGLPINVQVVGLPWQEEKILRVMKEIETALRK